jgi:hypothetical protein
VSDLIVAEETKVEKAIAVPQVHLVARDPQQMAAAQSNLTLWLENKLAAVTAEARELETARDYAKAHKWNYKALANQANKARHLVTYYDKMLIAVKAGMTLVPNFPIDFFAIRVKREFPNSDTATNSASNYTPSFYTPQNESPEALPAGEGRWVSPTGGEMSTQRYDTADKDGKITHHAEQWRTEFADVEFPLIAARPLVMDATQQAMAMKVFDRIGICPPQRKGDPLIIGQVILPPINWRNPKRFVSFLVAWHLDLNVL